MDNLLAHLRDRLLPLTEPLHEAFTAAHGDLASHALAANPDYGWLRSHNLRGYARHRLEAAEHELGDWSVTGNVRRNGEFWVATTDARLRARILRDGNSGVTPHAGTNTARRRFYRNLSLDPSLLSLTDAGAPEVHNLLILWTELEASEFAMRVVRPTGPGAHLRRVRSDIDIPMPRHRTDFENLEFVVSDEELEFDIADGELEADED